MSGSIEARLSELGITLPNAAAPAANYVPYVVSGNLIFVSGQIPILDGQIQYTGKVGADCDIDQGIASAKLCALNLIAQAKAACDGDLDRIKRVVKLGGFVACTPDFADHPKVINGASDLMAEVFGDKGAHSRFAVGAPCLPLNVTTEVEGIFEIS
jgi:enamine deaminase RidA (YjgF/YER057c/UK114 family)